MYLLLHSNIVVVNGASRSIICDLQNELLCIIPNSFATFIGFSNKRALKEIYDAYPKSEKSTIKEYIKWLEARGFIVWMQQKDTLDYFPEMKMEWESPFLFSNIIVDTYSDNLFWNRIIEEIELNLIPFLQIRFLNSVDIDSLVNFLNPTQTGPLKGIELIIPYDTWFTPESINKILQNNIRIYQVVIYNSHTSTFYQESPNSCPVGIIYTEENISERNCGLIEPLQFRANKHLYTEGISHNTCLNRKISVAPDGNIKNCPSMKQTFGNIKDTSFEEVMSQKGLKRFWNITKDKISICKVCEFRRVCTDCRAYLQNPDDVYSKPLKCGYDPYTNKWEEWSTNPLSKTGIEYYGMQDLVKQKAK